MEEWPLGLACKATVRTLLNNMKYCHFGPLWDKIILSFLWLSTHLLLFFKYLHPWTKGTPIFSTLALEPHISSLPASLQHGNFLLPTPTDIPHFASAWQLKQDALLAFLPHLPFPAPKSGSKRLEACWSHPSTNCTQAPPPLLLLFALALWERPDLPKAPMRKCERIQQTWYQPTLWGVSVSFPIISPSESKIFSQHLAEMLLLNYFLRPLFYKNLHLNTILSFGQL